MKYYDDMSQRSRVSLSRSERLSFFALAYAGIRSSISTDTKKFLSKKFSSFCPIIKKNQNKLSEIGHFFHDNRMVTEYGTDFYQSKQQ